MTPSRIRAEIVSERIAWIREMLQALRKLPLADPERFFEDPRNIAAAESYLRRGIEALLDLGRHILAKGCGLAAVDYKDIGTKLSAEGILSKQHAALYRQIAGYRNRMVHFYHEVTQEELYALCTQDVKDIEILLELLREWIGNHPEKMDFS